MANNTELYGWTAVPVSLKTLVSGLDANSPARINAADIEVPKSKIAEETYRYAKSELSEPTFNHSMRVFYYGYALIHTHFPEFKPSIETFFLTCLLHDIGTTHENLRATSMSFEFFGGMLAHEFLRKSGAPQSQAESVCEAIIRHQDLGEVGKITTVGALIQLATVFDNIGLNPQLIDKSTIESVTTAFPRLKWSSCFVSTLEEEISRKPWCHTTAIDGFAERVSKNVLMAAYE